MIHKGPWPISVATPGLALCLWRRQAGRPRSEEFHNHGEEDRGQKNSEERDADHPAEDRGSESLAHLRARTFGDRQR